MLLNTNSLLSTIPAVVLTNQPEPADRDLRRRVKTFLSISHRPGLRLLEVEAHAGVVRLRGNVKTFYEKQLSSQLARRVAGVVRLIDEVIVDHVQFDHRQGVVTIKLQSGKLQAGDRLPPRRGA
jgi:osmotically-inducible protein OsmY